MTEITRRALLRSTGLATVFLAAGCQGFGSMVSQAATDLSTIAKAIDGVLPTIATVREAAGTVMAKVSGAVADLKAIAAQVGNAISTQAGPLVLRAESILASIREAVQGINLPATVQSVLAAATELMPYIKTAVGIAAALVPMAGGMSADQARQVLLAAAR